MYLLIPLSLMLFVVGIWAVHFAVKSNQFEDLDNAAQRVILDDRQERRHDLNDNNLQVTSIKKSNTLPPSNPKDT